MDKPPRAWAIPGGEPCVVLGRSQHRLAVTPVLPVRHRASGGGAVLAGPWLLRSAVRLPRDHVLASQGPVPLARWVGGIHLQWLRAWGIGDAELETATSHEHWACFGGRSAGEVMVNGRKLTGIAQAWQRSGVLVTAGTLLYPPPWALLCDALGHPASEAADIAAGTITMEECLGRQVQARTLARSLRGALSAALVEAAPVKLDAPQRGWRRWSRGATGA